VEIVSLSHSTVVSNKLKRPEPIFHRRQNAQKDVRCKGYHNGCRFGLPNWRKNWG